MKNNYPTLRDVVICYLEGLLILSVMAYLFWTVFFNTPPATEAPASALQATIEESGCPCPCESQLQESGEKAIGGST